MRWMRCGLVLALLTLPLSSARADDDRNTSERVLGGVLSGLLGQPAPSPDAAYAAKEQERLMALLRSGEYATSRQGESIDTMILGIPLTRAANVYTAKPVQPSR